MKTTEVRDHCPRCLSAELWEVKASGNLSGMQCQDCGLVFNKDEMVVGVDLDI